MKFCPLAFTTWRSPLSMEREDWRARAASPPRGATYMSFVRRARGFCCQESGLFGVCGGAPRPFANGQDYAQRAFAIPLTDAERRRLRNKDLKARRSGPVERTRTGTAATFVRCSIGTETVRMVVPFVGVEVMGGLSGVLPLHRPPTRRYPVAPAETGAPVRWRLDGLADARAGHSGRSHSATERYYWA